MGLIRDITDMKGFRDIGLGFIIGLRWIRVSNMAYNGGLQILRGQRRESSTKRRRKN
jgi:hypothetical protein